MEPVTAQSSVPATGSADPAVGTCTAAANSASAANQRRSTQRRSPRDPSPRTRALVTGFVPAAALSSTLPRPSHHPKPPATTSLHLPPSTTHKPTTSDHVPTCHHLPQTATTYHRRSASDAAPQSRWVRCSTAAGWPASPRATASIDGATRSGARRARAWSPRGHGTRSEHTDVRALAFALAPHFALPVPGA